MLVTTPNCPHQKPPRFDALMDAYEANFKRLRYLAQIEFDAALCWRSSARRGPDLYLDVLEQHRFTSVIRMSYVLNEQLGAHIEPDVVARVYHDAKQVEVTSFRPGTLVRALCGPGAHSSTAFRQRWRMNQFLSKWLEYLLDCGHSQESWQVGPGIAQLAGESERVTNGLTNRIPECPAKPAPAPGEPA